MILWTAFAKAGRQVRWGWVEQGWSKMQELHHTGCRSLSGLSADWVE